MNLNCNKNLLIFNIILLIIFLILFIYFIVDTKDHNFIKIFKKDKQ